MVKENLEYRMGLGRRVCRLGSDTCLPSSLPRQTEAIQSGGAEGDEERGSKANFEHRPPTLNPGFN